MDAVHTEVFSKMPEKNGEIIFIDDGSGDKSYQVLKEIKEKQGEAVRVIKLARNFGQRSAIRCGLEFVRGKAAVVISADGQDPVHLIKRMLDLYFDGKHEIVIATRNARDESIYRKATSFIYCWLIKKLCFPKMPIGGFDFFLVGEVALSNMLSWYEPTGVTHAMVLSLGFDPQYVYYTRRARKFGKSKWKFGNKITTLLDAVLGNSFAPIRFISLLGLCFASAGFVYALRIFLNYLAHGHPIEGWSPIMIVILTMGGFQLCMLGLIGEYLWRTMSLCRRRPGFFIEKILGSSEKCDKVPIMIHE
jgi:dolichol-phosphate mannosyltransferase